MLPMGNGEVLVVFCECVENVQLHVAKRGPSQCYHTPFIPGIMSMGANTVIIIPLSSSEMDQIYL